jgi:Death domain
MFCDDNEIKAIDAEHRDFRTRTMVVLERYETRKNSLPKLLGALELMKRKDIVEQIQGL